MPVEKNKLKRPHVAQARGNDRKDGDSTCSPEQIANFPTLYLFFYWVLFGQLVILLLRLFGYEGLRPVIDWVASIIPSVESIRHSKIIMMNKELARAHYALMWLFSPVLIIAVLFSPVGQEERELFIKNARIRSNALYSWLPILLLIGFCFFLVFSDFSLGSHSSYYTQFSIYFAFLSSLPSSFIALTFLCIKLILTSPPEEL